MSKPFGNEWLYESRDRYTILFRPRTCACDKLSARYPSPSLQTGGDTACRICPYAKTHVERLSLRRLRDRARSSGGLHALGLTSMSTGTGGAPFRKTRQRLCEGYVQRPELHRKYRQLLTPGSSPRNLAPSERASFCYRGEAACPTRSPKPPVRREKKRCDHLNA